MPTAVIVDQFELLRLGAAQVAEEAGFQVAASCTSGGEGLRDVRKHKADLLIVGRVIDLKPQHILREAKKIDPKPHVFLLVDQAEGHDIARLVGLGAHALLLRNTSAGDLLQALKRLDKGERVVAPALAAGTLGRVGPNVHVTLQEAAQRSGLSPKELEVLGELAAGSTYKEISEALIVTQATIKTHLVHIYSKLEVKNRQEAIARALALGLLS